MKCDYSKYYNYTILQIIFKVMGGLTVTSRLAPNNGAQSDSTSSVSWEEDRQVPPPRTECSICTCCFQLQSLGTEREHVRSCYRGATSVQSCRQALFHSQGLDINYIINTIKNRHFFFLLMMRQSFLGVGLLVAASWAFPWTWNTWDSNILRRGCFVTKDGDKEGYFLSMAKPACVILRQDWNWCEIVFLSTS